MHGDPDIAWLAEFGDMDMVRRICAAHVEGVLGAVGADHAEIRQELFLLVEIGRAYPPVSEIEGFDHRHNTLPGRTCHAILEHFYKPRNPERQRSASRTPLRPGVRHLN